MAEVIAFSSGEKELLVPKIQAYLEKELDVEVGRFDAEFLLDFFAKEMGVVIYNKGLQDGMETLKVKLETVCDDVAYALEK